MKIVSGKYRLITDLEKQMNPILKGFYYTITEEYEYKEIILVHSDPTVVIGTERKIKVPVGFCTDGSSGGPDIGCSWIFHDYLYATHCFENGTCTRQEADNLMYRILEHEKFTVYAFVFKILSKLNPFYIFSRAWFNSGSQGPIFISPDDMKII